MRIKRIETTRDETFSTETHRFNKIEVLYYCNCKITEYNGSFTVVYYTKEDSDETNVISLFPMAINRIVYY